MEFRAVLKIELQTYEVGGSCGWDGRGERAGCPSGVVVNPVLVSWL